MEAQARAQGEARAFLYLGLQANQTVRELSSASLDKGSVRARSLCKEAKLKQFSGSLDKQAKII